MVALLDLRPQKQQRIMDLVKEAGVDISDWAHFKGDSARAASNPKYCYEWSFIEPQKVVVFNLWFESMEERAGTIVQELNMREAAHKYAREPKKPAWERRARNLDLAIQRAIREKLPIRVVICEGTMRDIENAASDASRVDKRLLDSMPWSATHCDWATGSCTLTRGALVDRFIDQFSLSQFPAQAPARLLVTKEIPIRSADVRRQALIRADGSCEWCTQPGFLMTDGRIYLETHHIIPLGEGGPDIEENVIALCPNHHREAHHGERALEMRKAFLTHLSQTVHH